MSTISAALVNELRKRTNLPMMKCKQALEAAGGDLDKAIEQLRIGGLKDLEKFGGREAAEGRIATIVDPGRVGVIVELRCESPPVVKAEHFVALGNDIARQIALKSPATIEELMAQDFVDTPGRTVADRVTSAISLIRENMKVHRFTRIEGATGDYVHHDGSVGVLLQVTGGQADPQLLRDVCMHITAAKPTPVAARREDVPADLLAKEQEIARAKAAATGKPAQIVEKIAEGQMKAWFAEHVLVEQPFVKDDSKSVGQVLQAAGLQAVKFVRYKVGEGA
jgi:elongation factor Ts